MSSRTYSGVTLQQAQSLLDTVKQYQGIVNGDMHTGTISDYGVSIRYDYDQAAQVLTLTVTQHPFWLPPDAVLSQIESHSSLKS